MNVELAWKTYLKVGISMIPTLFFALFFMVVNFPRAEAILKKAGFLDSNHEPSTALFRLIINSSYFVFNNLNLLLYAMVGALVVLEVWVKPWNRWRKRVCVVVAVLFNAYVLLGMTAASLTAFMALSVLQRAQ